MFCLEDGGVWAELLLGFVVVMKRGLAKLHSENTPQFSAHSLLTSQKNQLLVLLEFSCRVELFLWESVKCGCGLLWLQAKRTNMLEPISEKAPAFSSRLPGNRRWPFSFS